MKFQINSKKLAEILDFASRYIAKSATLPILKNVYIQTTGDELKVIATDMEKYIQITKKIKNEEEGALTVDVQTIFRIAKSIPDETISISTNMDKDTMIIKGDTDRFEIKGIPASEYVASPKVNETSSITLPTKKFSLAIEKVISSVSEKSFSPTFTGVFFNLSKDKGNKLICAGTDSFILSEYQIQLDQELQEDKEIIIPKSASVDLLHIAKSCTGDTEENTLTMNFGSNMIGCYFQYKDIEIYTTSILIQGIFPDYHNEKIMPTTFNTTINVNPQLLTKEINKIGILATDSKNLLLLDFQDKQLTLSNGKQDKGEGQTNLSIEKTGPDVKLYINGIYINNFISHIQGADLQINIVDNQIPLIFVDPNDEYYKAIVRPLQK